MNEESNYGGLEEIRQQTPEEIARKGMTTDEIVEGITFKGVKFPNLHEAINAPAKVFGYIAEGGEDETNFKALTPEEREAAEKAQEDNDNTCLSCGS